MARRYYTAVAPLLTLASGIDNVTTTLTVSSTSGYPSSYPFIVTLERGTVNEEVCLCTAKDATTFTVTRGWDGTSAVSHSSGATVEHTSSAVDYNEASEHINDPALDHHTQYVKKATWTAKGMIMVASGAATLSGLAVGSNNTVLLADSAQAGGVKWGTLVTASITDAAVTLAKLSTTLQAAVVQSVANQGSISSPVVGQTIYDQAADRWKGYASGGWFLTPHGVGKFTYTTGDPSGGSDGDVHLKYS